MWASTQGGRPGHSGPGPDYSVDSGRSASITVAAGLGVLVELAAQMEAFEHELERRRRAGRIARAELLHSGVQGADLGDLTDVLLGRHHVRDLDAEAVLEGGHDGVQLASGEAPVEDVEHRLLHQLAEDLVFAAVAERFHLDLAAGRGDDRPEVAHARRDLALVETNGALERVGQEVFPVADADPHRHARALADLRRLARQVRELGDDLLHVGRRDELEPGRRERCELGFHDRDLVFEPTRVVRADLGAEAVLERRDDPAPIGIVLGVGARDHVHVDRQADLVAADLDVPLFHDVEQPDLDALGEVGKLVDREDASVGPRHEPVVNGQLVAEVAALGDLDRVHLADEVGDGDIGGRELLAIAAVARDPGDLGLVAALGHAFTAGLTDRRERTVVDLAAGEPGDLGVEKLDQEARHAGLGLATLAQEHDVLAGENRVLDLGEDALLVPDDPWEDRFALSQPRDQVVPQLLLHRLRLVSTLPQLAYRSRFVHNRHYVAWRSRCQSAGDGRAYADQRSYQLDLAGMGHAVREARLAECADAWHLPQRLHGDGRFQVGWTGRSEKVVGAGPDLLHVLLEQGNVLQAERLGVLGRHARALSHRRKPELLGVPAFRPDGRPALLQHEAHHVVLGPRVMPKDPRQRVRLRVTGGHGVELRRGQVDERFVQHPVQALHLGANELDGGHHGNSPFG